MKKSYIIKGMTCHGCTVSIKNKLYEIPSINKVSLDLKTSTLEIDLRENISLQKLQEFIPEKYMIFEKSNHKLNNNTNSKKLSQLKPLFLILLYLFGISFFINWRNWNINDFMIDYMGLFFIFFSFFKLIDLDGFSISFKIYDPIAQRIPFYATSYPIIEIILGIMLLTRFRLNEVLLLVIFLLGMTTIGVASSILKQKEIKCACLGSVFQLPMTEVTLIENVIMIFMSIFMLIRL